MRQRVAGVLLVLGLILSWVCLTGVVVRQSLLLTAKAPVYATTALKNPVVRSAVSEVIISSVQSKYPVLAEISTAQLRAAVEQALSEPAVAEELGNVALQLQLHFIGQSNGPIVIGGPGLSLAVAQIIAPGNQPLQQAIEKVPFSFTLSSSSIPSIGRYYRWIGTLINSTFVGGLALLAASLLVSAKRNKTLRKIGIGFIGMSALEVGLFWLLPHYMLSHLSNGSGVIISAMLAASASSIAAIYLGVFVAGIALTVVSLIF